MLTSVLLLPSLAATPFIIPLKIGSNEEKPISFDSCELISESADNGFASIKCKSKEPYETLARSGEASYQSHRLNGLVPVSGSYVPHSEHITSTANLPVRTSTTLEKPASQSRLTHKEEPIKTRAFVPLRTEIIARADPVQQLRSRISSSSAVNASQRSAMSKAKPLSASFKQAGTNETPCLKSGSIIHCEKDPMNVTLSRSFSGKPDLTASSYKLPRGNHSIYLTNNSKYPIKIYFDDRSATDASHVVPGGGKTIQLSDLSDKTIIFIKIVNPQNLTPRFQLTLMLK